MDIDTLKSECEEVIERWLCGIQSSKFPSIPMVVPHMATGEKTKLCGKHGPYCEWIAQVQEGKGTVAYWDARKILKFIEQRESS